MNDISVNGAVRARMAAGPPSSPAGKNLTSVNPRPTAVISSEAVATPGNAGTPSSADRASTGDGQSRADDELRAGVDDLVDLRGDQHRPGADLEVGQRRREDPDRLDPRRGPQGDLDDVDAAGEQRLTERQCLGRIVDHHDRHDRASGQQGL